MWERRQLMMVGRYKRFAALDDKEYRDLLERATSCGARSSKDPRLDQRDFDVFMATIEAHWDWRIQEGLASQPPEGILLDYWRARMPKAGKVNTRQIHEIYDWWHQLKPFLPVDSRTPDYLRAIASKASKSEIKAITDLPAKYAGLLIEALKDRLRTERKRAPDVEQGIDQVPMIQIGGTIIDLSDEQGNVPF